MLGQIVIEPPVVIPTNGHTGTNRGTYSHSNGTRLCHAYAYVQSPPTALA